VAAGGVRRDGGGVVVPWIALSPDGVWDGCPCPDRPGPARRESGGEHPPSSPTGSGLYHAHVVATTTGAVSRDLAGPLPHDVATTTGVVALLAWAAPQAVRAPLPRESWAALRRQRRRAARVHEGALAAVRRVADPARPLRLVVVAMALLVVALALAQSWYFHYHDLWAGRSLRRGRCSPATSCGRALRAAPCGRRARRPRRKTSRQSGLSRSRASAAAEGSGAHPVGVARARLVGRHPRGVAELGQAQPPDVLPTG
jgi:hypothetical protein